MDWHGAVTTVLRRSLDRSHGVGVSTTMISMLSHGTTHALVGAKVLRPSAMPSVMPWHVVTDAALRPKARAPLHPLAFGDREFGEVPLLCVRCKLGHDSDARANSNKTHMVDFRIPHGSLVFVVHPRRRGRRGTLDDRRGGGRNKRRLFDLFPLRDDGVLPLSCSCCLLNAGTRFNE
jgi:hypothetical protein